MKLHIIKILLENRREASIKFGIPFHHTPPNPDHYPHLYLWDSCFCAIVFSRLGKSQYAVEEINEILKGQDKRGFIPGTRFVATAGRRFDPERIFFQRKDFGSDYSQPPVLALAAYETYKNLSKKTANNFLKDVFSPLSKYYTFLLTTRKGHDGLVYCIHPHETGRDSDPTFDSFKFRLARNGPQTSISVNLLNSLLDYVSALFINYKLKKASWTVSRLKKSFWVADIMFNCILVDNLRIMSEITTKKTNYFKKEADELEQAILKKLSNNKVASISNLFLLVLLKVPENKIKKILNLLEDEHWFGTPFLIPSVPVNSKNFDPHYGEKGRLWRGPAWINTNWYLHERGLLKQLVRTDISPATKKRLKKIAAKIKSSSQSLTQKGYFEFYDPYTGTGYRIKNFAMSTLAAVFS